MIEKAQELKNDLEEKIMHGEEEVVVATTAAATEHLKEDKEEYVENAHTVEKLEEVEICSPEEEQKPDVVQEFEEEPRPEIFKGLLFL